MENIRKRGFALVRIITGALVAWHGLEVFDSTLMKEYASWDSVKNLPFPLLLVYLGKISELAGGLLLAVGFLTRPASLLVAATMLFICFIISNGRFWYEDQHPFLLFLLAMNYYFAGPGIWSLDKPRSH